MAAQRLPVASLGDVLATKLLALTEQDPDLGSVLEIARSLREQIDWDFVRARTDDSPFARAFFTLVEELGIVDPAAARPGRPSRLHPDGVEGVHLAGAVEAVPVPPVHSARYWSRPGRGL